MLGSDDGSKWQQQVTILTIFKFTSQKPRLVKSLKCTQQYQPACYCFKGAEEAKASELAEEKKKMLIPVFSNQRTHMVLIKKYLVTEGPQHQNLKWGKGWSAWSQYHLMSNATDALLKEKSSKYITELRFGSEYIVHIVAEVWTLFAIKLSHSWRFQMLHICWGVMESNWVAKKNPCQEQICSSQAKFTTLPPAMTPKQTAKIVMTTITIQPLLPLMTVLHCIHDYSIVCCMFSESESYISIYYSAEHKGNWCVALDPLGCTGRM